MEGKEYYQFLLNRYLNGLATEPEQEELFSELQKRKDDKEWEDLLHELFINHQKTTEYDEAEWEPVIEKILERGKQKKRVGKNNAFMDKNVCGRHFHFNAGNCNFFTRK